MPRDGSGTYSKAEPSFIAGEVIEPAPVNNVIDDIVADLNAARPVVAGGTGASSASGARAALNVAPQQDTVDDTTAGSGLILGAFGLGDKALGLTSFNTTTGVTQFFKATTATPTGAPYSGNVWAGIEVAKSTGQSFQLAVDTVTGKAYLREQNASTWASDWEQIVTEVDREDDGAGNIAIRYSNGVQIARSTGASMQCDTAAGGGYRSTTEICTFALEFISVPHVDVTARRTAIGTSAPWAVLANSTAEDDNAVTTTTARAQLLSFEQAWGKITYSAWGYWR